MPVPASGIWPYGHFTVNEVDDGAIALQLHAGGEANMRFKDILIRDRSVR